MKIIRGSVSSMPVQLKIISITLAIKFIQLEWLTCREIDQIHITHNLGCSYFKTKDFNCDSL